MISSFWSGLGSKLAERWAAALFTPAFAFWALGVGAWLLSRPDAAARRRLMNGFEGLSGIAQTALIVLALLVVAASSVVAERLALAVLRALEGYWPRPLRQLARALVRRHAARFEAMEQRWDELYARHEEGRSAPGEQQELVDLERRLAAMPAHADRLMPTRLGNVLRAAESGVEDKYGIDPVRCWPALWLVLPDVTRTEVTAARASLDTAATWSLWSVLVAVWAVFTPWAVLVAVVAASRRTRTCSAPPPATASSSTPHSRCTGGCSTTRSGARGLRSRPTSGPPARRSPQRCGEGPRWPPSFRAGGDQIRVIRPSTLVRVLGWIALVDRTAYPRLPSMVSAHELGCRQGSCHQPKRSICSPG